MKEKKIEYYTYSKKTKKYYFENWEYTDKSFVDDFKDCLFIRIYIKENKDD